MGFFDTDENIKGALRLSGMPTTGDGQLMYLKAVRRASVTIRRALGETAAALVAAGSTLTQDHAKLVEIDLILCELVKTMPYASLDGSAGMDEWFDKEAPFRHMSEEERQAMIERMCSRAQEDLCTLADDINVDCGAEKPIECFIIEGETVGCSACSGCGSYAGSCGC